MILTGESKVDLTELLRRSLKDRTPERPPAAPAGDVVPRPSKRSKVAANDDARERAAAAAEKALAKARTSVPAAPRKRPPKQ